MVEAMPDAMYGVQYVCREGYKIDERPDPSRPAGSNAPVVPCLVENSDERDVSKRYRIYNPFESDFGGRDLYHRIAELPAWNADAVIAFATEYGGLGPFFPAVEPLGEWVRRGNELRHALFVWEQIRGNRVGSVIRDRFTPLWDKGVLVAWQYNFPIGFKNIYPVEGVTLYEKDLRTPIGILLSQLIRDGLGDRSRVVTVYDPATQMPAVRVISDGLLGAAWLRLAKAVTGGQTVRVCAVPGCGKLFTIADGREERRVVCSDACRQKRFRQLHKTPTKKGNK